MLHKSVLFAVATLGVGIAIGSCDSPGGEGRLLGTEPAAAGSQLALAANAVGISACVGKGSGLVRVPVAGEACRDNEDPVALGGGLTGYEIVTKDEIFAPNTTGSFGSMTIDCPDGKRVLGGGAGAISASDSRVVFTTAATFGNGDYPADEDSWRVSWDVRSDAVSGVRGFAVCAY